LAGPTQLQGINGDPALAEWLSLAVVFVLVVAVMAGLGQGVARTFALFRPLEAYRLDIIGSVGGIALFSLMSFLDLPPFVWGLTVVGGFLVLLGVGLRWWQWVAVAIIMALLGLESSSAVDRWSPYYKVTSFAPQGTNGVYVVSANNIPHQTVYPVDTLHKILP